MANYAHLLFVFLLFQLVRVITAVPAMPSIYRYAKEEVYPYWKYGSVNALGSSEFGGYSFFG